MHDPSASLPDIHRHPSPVNTQVKPRNSARNMSEEATAKGRACRAKPLDPDLNNRGIWPHHCFPWTDTSKWLHPCNCTTETPHENNSSRDMSGLCVAWPLPPTMDGACRKLQEGDILSRQCPQYSLNLIKFCLLHRIQCRAQLQLHGACSNGPHLLVRQAWWLDGG